MKFKLLYITLFLCLANSSYANDSSIHVSMLGESMENGTAASVGIYTGNDVLYGGLSFSYIESSEVIQYDNRKTIHPIYFFMGIKAPWRISPFFEAGIDLPEAFIDDLLNNEDESESQADYYFSTGLVFIINEKVDVSLFAKKYNFIFRENIYAPTFKVRPRTYGVGVSVRF